MTGVMIPSVSAGSSQRVASVIWTPHVIVPSGAAETGPAPPRMPRHARNTLAMRRLMVDPPLLCSGISRATSGRQPANWGRAHGADESDPTSSIVPGGPGTVKLRRDIGHWLNWASTRGLGLPGMLYSPRRLDS